MRIHPLLRVAILTIGVNFCPIEISAQTAQNAEDMSPLDVVKFATVKVTRQYLSPPSGLDGCPPIEEGTGLIVSRGLVMTSAHVVVPRAKCGPHKISVAGVQPYPRWDNPIAPPAQSTAGGPVKSKSFSLGRLGARDGSGIASEREAFLIAADTRLDCDCALLAISKVEDVHHHYVNNLPSIQGDVGSSASHPLLTESVVYKRGWRASANVGDVQSWTYSASAPISPVSGPLPDKLVVSRYGGDDVYSVEKKVNPGASGGFVFDRDMALLAMWQKRYEWRPDSGEREVIRSFLIPARTVVGRLSALACGKCDSAGSPATVFDRPGAGELLVDSVVDRKTDGEINGGHPQQAIDFFVTPNLWAVEGGSIKPTVSCGASQAAGVVYFPYALYAEHMEGSTFRASFELPKCYGGSGHISLAAVYRFERRWPLDEIELGAGGPQFKKNGSMYESEPIMNRSAIVNLITETGIGSEGPYFVVSRDSMTEKSVPAKIDDYWLKISQVDVVIDDFARGHEIEVSWSEPEISRRELGKVVLVLRSESFNVR
jgi:hypothetical protein